MLNLRSVDLNLLPIFEVVYEEKHLSRAAARLAMSQPSVSQALARLRHVFKDELFVRNPRGVTPTPMADAIHARLGEALGMLRSTIVESRGFDPKVSERQFVVAIPHPLGPILALALLQRMEAVAPNVSLEFGTQSRPVELARNLMDGKIDLAVDWLPAGRASISEEEVVQDELVVVARRTHPVVKARGTWKALVSGSRFVFLRPRIDGNEHPLEGVREFLQLGPDVALHVSAFTEVLMVVARSDLLGIVPKSLAKASSQALGIQVLAVTPRLQPFSIRMAWRNGRTTDPAHKFLRDQVRAVMKEVIKG